MTHIQVDRENGDISLNPAPGYTNAEKAERCLIPPEKCPFEELGRLDLVRTSLNGNTILWENR